MFKIINKVYKTDKVFFLMIVVLSSISLIMVASASVGLAADDPTAVLYNLLRQSIYFVIGYFLMFSVARLYSNTLFKKLTWFFAIVLTLSLIACLAFPAINGAKGWIQLGFFTIQPSEFTKTFFIVYLATYLPNFRNREVKVSDIIIKPIVLLILWIAIIFFFQNDFGSAIVLVLLAGGMVVMTPGAVFSGLRLVVKCAFGIVLLTYLFIFSPAGTYVIEHLPLKEYQTARITSVSNPFENIYKYSYQLFNSLLAFAKSDWWGQGFGNSVQKFGYLPESRTDFIFPIIIEELGIWGLLIVAIPYMYIIYSLFSYSLKFKNPTDKMILVGTIMYFMIHVVLNIGGASGLVPLTGVPLLLVSSGGSSTFSIMILLGVCFSIIRKNIDKNARN